MKKKIIASKQVNFPIAGVIAGIVVGMFLVGVVVAADAGFSWSNVEKLVAEKLYGEVQGDTSLGDTGESGGDRNVTGLYDLTLKDSDSSEDTFWLSNRVFRGTIGTASSTFLSIQNTSGNDWLVDRFTLKLDATASGTLRLSCGTSTIAFHTTNGIHGALNTDPEALFGKYIATSTASGVYSSSTFTNAGQNVAVELVRNNEYVLCGLWSGDADGGNSILSTTSTASRGFSASSWYTLEVLEYATST